MHNFFLEDNRDSNPRPFIGDVQLQTFLSFATNQLKWAQAHNNFRRHEEGIKLWVRGEPAKHLQLLSKQKKFMKRASVIGELGPFHTYVIQARKEYFQEIKEEASPVARQRWEASNITVRNREPFGYGNFKAASSHFYKYSNMILTMGPEWTGCRYRTTIIWYPLDKYCCHYNLKN